MSTSNMFDEERRTTWSLGRLSRTSDTRRTAVRPEEPAQPQQKAPPKIGAGQLERALYSGKPSEMLAFPPQEQQARALGNLSSRLTPYRTGPQVPGHLQQRLDMGREAAQELDWRGESFFKRDPRSVQRAERGGNVFQNIMRRDALFAQRALRSADGGGYGTRPEDKPYQGRDPSGQQRSSAIVGWAVGGKYGAATAAAVNRYVAPLLEDAQARIARRRHPTIDPRTASEDAMLYFFEGAADGQGGYQPGLKTVREQESQLAAHTRRATTPSRDPRYRTQVEEGLGLGGRLALLKTVSGTDTRPGPLAVRRRQFYDRGFTDRQGNTHPGLIDVYTDRSKKDPSEHADRPERQGDYSELIRYLKTMRATTPELQQVPARDLLRGFQRPRWMSEKQLSTEVRKSGIPWSFDEQ